MPLAVVIGPLHPKRVGDLHLATIAGATGFLVMLAAGGSSALAPLHRMVAELIGMAILLLALWRIDVAEFRARDRIAALLLVALLALVGVQLVPLPPALWSALPGRALAVDGDLLMFGSLPSRPISLDSDGTIRAALMLVPAIGVYLFTLFASPARRGWIAAVLVGFAFLSLLLALAQTIAGHPAALHLYDNSHSRFATGFFSNRNHQAAAMATAIPLLAAWLDALAYPARVRLTMFALGAALLATGAAITASRTGALLLVPAIAGGGLIVTRTRLGNVRRMALLMLGGGVAAALAAVAMVLSGGPLAALADRSLGDEDSRLRFWPQVLHIAREQFPTGSGFGTFRAVYDAAEPNALLAPLYLNHAHNDWLELALEGGAPVLLLLAAFLAWFAQRGVQGWRADTALSDTSLRRAAAISVLCLLLHSIVDYPLRTIALSVVFAFCLALLTRGRETGQL